MYSLLLFHLGLHMKSELRFVLLLGLVAVLMASCHKKDDDASPPIVIVEQPFEKQVFAYGDTVFIRANISHSLSITSIKVALVNGTQTPVLPALNFELSGNTYFLNTHLVLDDVLLAEGKYTLQIKVSDAQSSWNSWVDIQYIEAEKQLLSVVAVVKSGMNSYDVLESPLKGNVLKLFSFTGDHSGSALNPEYNILYTAGSFMSGLAAWDLNDKRLLWSVPAVVSSAQAWIYALHADEKEVFVSTRDGYIEGYDYLGQVTFRSLKMENGVHTRILKSKDKLYGVFEPYNGTFSELVVFNYPGGSLARKMQINGEVVYLSNYSRDVVLVFVNQPNRAVVYEYSVSNHTLVELKTFSFSSIKTVAGDGKYHYFLHSGEDIWWYRPDLNSATKYVQTSSQAFMAFDDLNNRLYVGSPNKITGYGLPFSEVVYSLDLPFPLVSFNLRYNK